jgi:hypothetical protein
MLLRLLWVLCPVAGLTLAAAALMLLQLLAQEVTNVGLQAGRSNIDDNIARKAETSANKASKREL